MDLVQDGSSFTGVDVQQDPNNQEMMTSESTIMEGFRYRIVDDLCPQFPVFQGREKMQKFPVLPMGMIDLWKNSDNDPWGEF